MSRATAWVDRDQQEKDGQLEIMRDKAGSVDVFRQQQAKAGAGFTGEVREQTFLRTIEARIDGSTDEPDRAVDTEADTQKTLVALTDDLDVLKGDSWKWNDIAGQPRFYRVISVRAIQLGWEVQLDELRRSAWPKLQA